MFEEVFVVLFSAGQLMFAGAYVLKDLRLLRLLTALGCLLVTPYYLLREEPLWSPLIWLAIYFVINTWRLLWRNAPPGRSRGEKGDTLAV
jgi:hypothetical protein